jgi:hypothetical protein
MGNSWGNILDTAETHGFVDDVLLMRAVLQDWCALRGVDLDSLDGVRAATILLGLAQGRNFSRRELLQTLLEKEPGRR